MSALSLERQGFGTRGQEVQDRIAAARETRERKAAERKQRWSERWQKTKQFFSDARASVGKMASGAQAGIDYARYGAGPMAQEAAAVGAHAVSEGAKAVGRGAEIAAGVAVAAALTPPILAYEGGKWVYEQGRELGNRAVEAGQRAVTATYEWGVKQKEHVVTGVIDGIESASNFFTDKRERLSTWFTETRTSVAEGVTSFVTEQKQRVVTGWNENVVLPFHTRVADLVQGGVDGLVSLANFGQEFADERRAKATSIGETIALARETMGGSGNTPPTGAVGVEAAAAPA